MGNKLKLKDALQAIGLLFALITSFLGLLYIFKGDILISGLISVVIVIVLYFLINEMIKSKGEITRNKFSVKSIFLWSIFIGISMPLSLLLVHCLNVELNEKKNIQAIANAKTKGLTDMVMQYNTKVDGYLNTLRTGYSSDLGIFLKCKKPQEILKYESILTSAPYNLPKTDLDKITENNIDLHVNNFIGAKKYLFSKVADTIDFNNKIFYKKYNSVFDSWKRLKLNYAFYELDTILSSNLFKLQNEYLKQSKESNEGFIYPYSKEKGSMDKPSELWQKHHPYWLFILVIIFNIFLLLPYFLSNMSRGADDYDSNDAPIHGGIEIK